MPHLTLYASEGDLAGHEHELVHELTSAVADVYGDWARDMVHILLIGVPVGRWGVAGEVATSPAPTLTFGIRASAFERPDAGELVPRLVRALTDAVGAVFGSEVAGRTQVELVSTPAGRSAVGGRLVD